MPHLFTTRSGLPGATQVAGSSAQPYDSFNLADHVGDAIESVQDSRALLLESLQQQGVGRLWWMNQVHGDRVVTVGTPGRAPSLQMTAGPDRGVDGLVTAERGVALAVLVADCVPVLLTDDASGVVAAVHAGRKGAALDIVGIAVERMRSLGAGPIAAHLGPSICGSCYEVPQSMQDEVVQTLPGSACVTHDGTAGLDLRAGIAQRLLGLEDVTVTIDPRCTREDPTLYSHRRDGVTGRLAGVVWS